MAPQPKLNGELIAEICAAKRANPATSNGALAEQFGLNRTTIQKALVFLNAPTAANDVAAPGGSISTTDIAFELLHESPLNPRKFFDPDLLAELANNIADKGILQNIIVRPKAGQPGHYEIMGGARRYRAVALLVADGRWNGAAIPARVIETDDAGHIAYAILENLQRTDPSPLEEADAMQALQASAPEIWTAKAIAQAIGKTARYVYQRLALANKLSPGAKQALTEGRMTVEAARMLSAQEPAVQDEILFEMNNNGTEIVSAADVRYEVQQYYIPISRALFIVDPNEMTIDRDMHDNEYFEIPAEFWKHQNAAIAAKEAELKATWPWVLVSRPESRIGKIFVKDLAAPKEERGAIIYVDKNGEVNIWLDQVDDTRENDGANFGDDGAEISQTHAHHQPDLRNPVPEIPAPEPKSAVTKSHIYHAHHRKTVALRAAVAADPLLAIRCACFGYLCTSNYVVHVRAHEFNLIREDRVEIAPQHEAIISKLLGKVKPPQYANDAKAEAAVWKRIASLEVDDLYSLHAALVARAIGTFAMFDCATGDNPIAIEIAIEAGLFGNEDKHGLTVTREDLNGVRKQTLLAIADDAGTPAINDEMKPSDIAAVITAKSPTYVLPTLRFGTSAKIEKELAFK